MDNAAHMLGAFAARRLADESLFSRAISGDAVAFSEVYRRYEKRVYGFCLARSLDREAAADATQEVFIRLLKASPGTIDHPRAWLFAVARNVATDSLRKHMRLRESGAVDEDSPAWEARASADTADEVSARAEARSVFLTLRSMKPRYRTALILREIHSQSSADIAEAMGVRSAGAVDTLVSRARDAFGVAYAAVSELPQTCRRTVELIYRSRGTGISAQESVVLKAHMASCERCRREEARAGDANRLSALLPLLVPAGGAAHGLLARAALAGGNVPDVAAAQPITQFLQEHLHTVGSRIVAGVLAATLVAVPVVAVKTVHRETPKSAVMAADSPLNVSSGEPRASRGPVNWPNGAALGFSARYPRPIDSGMLRARASHMGRVGAMRSGHVVSTNSSGHGHVMPSPAAHVSASGVSAHGVRGTKRSIAGMAPTRMNPPAASSGRGGSHAPGM